MKFWVGSNDVGPHGFSGLTEIDAPDLDKAKRLAALMFDMLPKPTTAKKSTWFFGDRPRRKDRVLRIAVVPREEMRNIPGGTGPGGIKVPSQYVVEIKKP